MGRTIHTDIINTVIKAVYFVHITHMATGYVEDTYGQGNVLPSPQHPPSPRWSPYLKKMSTKSALTLICVYLKLNPFIVPSPPQAISSQAQGVGQVMDDSTGRDQRQHVLLRWLQMAEKPRRVELCPQWNFAPICSHHQGGNLLPQIPAWGVNHHLAHSLGLWRDCLSRRLYYEGAEFQVNTDEHWSTLRGHYYKNVNQGRTALCLQEATIDCPFPLAAHKTAHRSCPSREKCMECSYLRDLAVLMHDVEQGAETF